MFCRGKELFVMANNNYENMDEKPLDRICESGGATAILRSIA